MERRTKIVCTLGPAVASEDAILRLVQDGMNVARLIHVTRRARRSQAEL